MSLSDFEELQRVVREEMRLLTEVTMPASKLSVLNTVKKYSNQRYFGSRQVLLSDEDFDRLIRALEREDALRRIAYEFTTEWAKGGGFSGDMLFTKFRVALKQNVTEIDVKTEVARMVKDGLSADYIAERVMKLMRSVRD